MEKEDDGEDDDDEEEEKDEEEKKDEEEAGVPEVVSSGAGAESESARNLADGDVEEGEVKLPAELLAGSTLLTLLTDGRSGR